MSTNIVDSHGPASGVAPPLQSAQEAQGICGSPEARHPTLNQTDWGAERRRKRVVRAAHDHLKTSLPGNFKGRAWALDKIAANRQPFREAKRLVAWFRNQDVAVEAEEIGFDSVQELRVRLIRRDLFLDTPQQMLLNRMDRLIATGEMDRARFERLAATVLAMKPALSLEVRARLASE